MPENASATPPQVQDNRIKPPGVLPKNIQPWLLSGIALLMVGVIVLSGKNPPKERRTSSASPAIVLDPNAGRIQEYQKRIDEQARKLQIEQAQLVRTQQVLGVAPAAARTRTPQAGESTPYYPRDERYAPASSQQDWVEADRRKREYQSLFAPNIVLTYRAEHPSRETQEKTALSANSRPAVATPPQAQHPEQKGVTLVGPDGAKRTEAQETKRSNDTELERAEGKLYRLFEGTVLETVLTNRLDGYFSGPINCMVTTNIYSHDGQRLLIPQGSRVLGEVRRVESFGQQRLAVIFHRLIMPDGYATTLDKFQGLNQVGETGLRDQVNHHYLQVFGASVAIGAIAGLSQVNTRYSLDESATDAYRQGVASSLSQSSLRILDRYLNVLPTFTVREGHRVKIYLSEDLLLPAYEKHQMPSDL